MLTEDELKSLTLDAFKAQNIVYNQLSLLGLKLSEQTTYIENLKAKLEDKQQKYRFVATGPVNLRSSEDEEGEKGGGREGGVVEVGYHSVVVVVEHTETGKYSKNEGVESGLKRIG